MIFRYFNLFFVKHFEHTSRRQILTRIILGAVKPVTCIIWIIQVLDFIKFITMSRLVKK